MKMNDLLSLRILWSRSEIDNQKLEVVPPSVTKVSFFCERVLGFDEEEERVKSYSE